jgi:hypothetical protein
MSVACRRPPFFHEDARESPGSRTLSFLDACAASPATAITSVGMGAKRPAAFGNPDEDLLSTTSPTAATSAGTGGAPFDAGRPIPDAERRGYDPCRCFAPGWRPYAARQSLGRIASMPVTGRQCRRTVQDAGNAILLRSSTITPRT